MASQEEDQTPARRALTERRPWPGASDGSEMQADDWVMLGALAMLVSVHGIAERGPRGERRFDDFPLLVNAGHEPVEILLPYGFEPSGWLVVDSAEASRAVGAQDRIWAAQSYPLQGRSLALLRRTRPLR